VEPKAWGRRKAAIWAGIAGLGIAIALLVALPRFSRRQSLAGAVLVANADPRKQLPVANVEITAEAGGAAAQAKSDASGYFRLAWQARMLRGEEVTLRFRHPDYQPLEVTEPLGKQLYVIRMMPSAPARSEEPHGPEVPVADIRIRYSTKATTTINIGSTSKTWEVGNRGNVPCDGRPPCSPDGKWKAAIGSVSINAGESQEFQNVRVSCIAGPCPFTKIEPGGLAEGGPKIEISVRDWSDTVTYLVEAEVVRTMVSDAIRESYPSIFGRDMTFTLPPTGEGPSIEAEVSGMEIVFPLGPDLSLSWASCNMQLASNRTKLFSCELKAGYRFG
jgi:hypothetical protein